MASLSNPDVRPFGLQIGTSILTGQASRVLKARAMCASALGVVPSPPNPPPPVPPTPPGAPPTNSDSGAIVGGVVGGVGGFVLFGGLLAFLVSRRAEPLLAADKTRKRKSDINVDVNASQRQALLEHTGPVKRRNAADARAVKMQNGVGVRGSGTSELSFNLAAAFEKC